QWKYNGDDLPGAVQASLVLTNLQLDQAGRYQVVVSNTSQILTSRAATLAVGVVAAWGPSGYNNTETNVPPHLTNIVDVATHGACSLGITAQGKVIGWGPPGWLNVQAIPSDLPSVRAIAAGNNHALALRWGGTVVAWGDNSNGQTNVPAGLNQVVAI